VERIESELEWHSLLSKNDLPEHGPCPSVWLPNSLKSRQAGLAQSRESAQRFLGIRGAHPEGLHIALEPAPLHREGALKPLLDLRDAPPLIEDLPPDVEPPLVAASGRQVFVHEPQEHIHPLKDALDLQDLDGVVQEGVEHLELLVALRCAIENRKSSL